MSTPLHLPWDGSDVGEVSTHVVHVIDGSTTKLLVFDNGISAFITKFLGTICLIADELKPIFGLEKIGRHVCKYNGENAMLHRTIGTEHRISDVESQVPLEDVRRSIFFRWVLGLTLNRESSLLRREYKSGVVRVTSYNEPNYNYMSLSPQGSVVTKKMLKKWFVTYDEYDKFVVTVVGTSTYFELSERIRKVIERIDLKHGIWTASMMSRLNQYL